MGETNEYFTEWNETYESFDQMNLHENLLRGIYAYGAQRGAAQPAWIGGLSAHAPGNAAVGNSGVERHTGALPHTGGPASPAPPHPPARRFREAVCHPAEGYRAVRQGSGRDPAGAVRYRQDRHLLRRHPAGQHRLPLAGCCWLLLRSWIVWGGRLGLHCLRCWQVAAVHALHGGRRCGAARKKLERSRQHGNRGGAALAAAAYSIGGPAGRCPAMLAVEHCWCNRSHHQHVHQQAAALGAHSSTTHSAAMAAAGTGTQCCGTSCSPRLPSAARC